jgi:hypothetical protein
VTIQEAGLDGFWLHRRLEHHEATSSSQPRSPCRAGTGVPRPTGSTARS